ncbi:isochorismatase family cysteine hydrolase [Rhizosaccharibacter radicis]|uniref:Cysteine hydrolase n=1 Tax=Rhizosaccharibacter radicis TaxID=2782605 RepID=A0ABT1W149_9PROT|nr:cysteine hydrolase [Acetobacteraceae bacterium KSS12]
MTITVLDPVPALLLIDLQQGIVTQPLARPGAEIVAAATVLADGFRRRCLPVIPVQVVGLPPGRPEHRMPLEQLPPEWFELVPEIAARADGAVAVKRSWGAFTGTGLENRLRALGATQLVIAGIATSIGVESTARQAHELGFNVALATDAMTDRHEDAHRHSVERIFPALGECGTTADILRLLDRP